MPLDHLKTTLKFQKRRAVPSPSPSCSQVKIQTNHFLYVERWVDAWLDKSIQ